MGILSDAHYKIIWPDNLVTCELTKKLPFADGSMKYAYSSHFLEHVSYDDAKKVLKEVHRVLGEGGIARIVVPDVRWHVQQYLDGVMQTTHTEPFLNAADNFMYEMRLRSNSRDPHLWMYDEISLTQRMVDAGFKNVKVCNFKEGKCIDIDILDNRPGYSVHIEGEK
jgi:predicted SAM-dependent methyltransferase